MYVPSQTKVLLLLSEAENYVFASRKGFRKNKQGYTDYHSATEKVKCAEYFYVNLFQFGIHVFREKEKNTKLPNFPTVHI